MSHAAVAIVAAPRPSPRPGTGLVEAARIMTLLELLEQGALAQRVARADGRDVGASSIYPRVSVRLEGLFGWLPRHPDRPGRALRATASALLTNLEVIAGWRRRGVGRLLVDDACRLAREAGRAQLVAFVAEDNQTAHRFYQRLGFVHVRNLAALVAGGEPCREYARKLG